MDAHKVIAAETTLALAGNISADVLAQNPAQRGLPNPRRIIATLAFFGVLSWVSGLGQQAARVSATVGGVVTLLIILGPGSYGIEQLIRNLAGLAATPAGQQAQPASTASSGGGGIGGTASSIAKSLWGILQGVIPGLSLGSSAASSIGSAIGSLFSGGGGAPAGTNPARAPGSTVTGRSGGIGQGATSAGRVRAGTANSQ